MPSCNTSWVLFREEGLFPPEWNYEIPCPAADSGPYCQDRRVRRPQPNHSSSIVASGSSRIGIPLRMGYTRLHSLHLKDSSPRSTRGLRQTGQARISSSSGVIIP